MFVITGVDHIVCERKVDDSGWHYLQLTFVDDAQEACGIIQVETTDPEETLPEIIVLEEAPIS